MASNKHFLKGQSSGSGVRLLFLKCCPNYEPHRELYMEGLESRLISMYRCSSLCDLIIAIYIPFQSPGQMSAPLSC